MKEIYIDVETTGTRWWENTIHQIGLLVDIDGVQVESHDLKIKPIEGKIIEPKALEISGKTAADLETYPSATIVKAKLSEITDRYIDKYDKYDKFHIIGYNVHFDIAFLRQFYLDMGDIYYGSVFWSDAIDVMVLASNELKDIRHKMKNFQLRTVAETLGIVVDESKLHDAMYDLELTKQLYYMLK